MIRKGHICLLVLIVLIVLILGPIIINAFMFEQNFKEVHGTEEIWISSLSTYFGAIIGGVISGVLTLWGVKLTIKEQRRMMLQEKIDKAEFIYKKMVLKREGLNFSIEYYNPKDVYEFVTSLIKIIDEHSKMLNETEFEFFRRIEVIREELERIKKFFDDEGGPNGPNVQGLLDVLVISNRIIKNTFILLRNDYFSKYK